MNMNHKTFRHSKTGPLICFLILVFVVVLIYFSLGRSYQEKAAENYNYIPFADPSSLSIDLILLAVLIIFTLSCIFLINYTSRVLILKSDCIEIREVFCRLIRIPYISLKEILIEELYLERQRRYFYSVFLVTDIMKPISINLFPDRSSIDRFLAELQLFKNVPVNDRPYLPKETKFSNIIAYILTRSLFIVFVLVILASIAAGIISFIELHKLLKN